MIKGGKDVSKKALSPPPSPGFLSHIKQPIVSHSTRDFLWDPCLTAVALLNASGLIFGGGVGGKAGSPLAVFIQFCFQGSRKGQWGVTTNSVFRQCDDPIRPPGNAEKEKKALIY